jgi:hypothetical protein
VLASGGLLALAGGLVESTDWATAGVIATLAGIATQAAFYLGRRTERSASYVGPSRRSESRPRKPRRVLVGAWALMMLSGAMMAAAGYFGASEGWHLAGPLMFFGGPVIGASYLLDRHARAP